MHVTMDKIHSIPSTLSFFSTHTHTLYIICTFQQSAVARVYMHILCQNHYLLIIFITQHLSYKTERRSREEKVSMI